MITKLFAKLNAEVTILTPNQRLAANLSKKYQAAQVAQGLKAWPCGQLLPLKAFLHTLWDTWTAAQMTVPYLLLSAQQELIVWEEIISATPQSEHFLKLSDLAKQAKSAWATLAEWQLDFNHPSFTFTENCRYFQSWAEEFLQRTHAERWLDSARLTPFLIEKIHQKDLALPAELVLLNFTEISPLLKAFIRACESCGVVVEELTLKHSDSPPTCWQLAVTDQETEIQTMARWAKAILDREPQATIGCIASQLEEKRDSFLSIFKDILGNQEHFNISAGKTLASYPIIQHALQLLALPRETLSGQLLSGLLHSPFIGDAEVEMLARAKWDSFLRRRNMHTLSWQQLFKDPQGSTCPAFLKRFENYLKRRFSQRSQQTMSQWLAHFAASLEELGWPGEQSLNSSEYQVVNAWLNLLKEALRLESILPELTYAKALHYLTELVSKSFFQPQTPEAPVQVLGQLEGAGLPFDYLWVMGLDDTAWPPLPSPNPLLPQDLQKSLKLPNASAERQLEYSRRLTLQFKQAAGTVIFSYAAHNEKDELRPSPLIAALPLITAADLSLSDFNSSLKNIFFSQQLETFSDEKAPPIAAGETLQGGVSIFEHQAACPFKAFAKLRLKARALEVTQAGLPPRSRGSVIHKALELFWRQVRDQKTLLLLDDKTLSDKIHQVLTSALKSVAPFIPATSLYQSLVCLRLEKLLYAWLNLEKARPPFKVLALEEEKLIEFEHFVLRLRIDRIDELALGEKLLIDYKTKKNCDTSAWLGERLDEPQLPLYCISSQEEIAGLAFAELHAATTEIKGLSQQPLGISGIKTLSEKLKNEDADWKAQLLNWREALVHVFQDFLQGFAAVDPQHPVETCRYCDLHSFCRIHEQRQLAYE